MKRVFKRIVFALIVISLMLGIGVVAKKGKFEKLEGYKYSLALDGVEITDDELEIEDNPISNNSSNNNSTIDNSTGGNATSCNATSSNATSSNATSCNATSTNATSSNSNGGTTITETIKVTNTPIEEIEPEEEIPVITPKPNEQNQQNNEDEPEEDEEINLEYNNSEITKDILSKIANSTKLENITINMDENTNISKDVFEAIEGKNIKLIINSNENQIIFRGNNITNPKRINAEITYNLISEDVLLREIVAEGIVVNFADNGELPGTATVRIKVTDEISETLSFNKMPVYYYNEETKELTKLKSNAKYNEEGFIEFSIKHNSKYLIVNDVIKEKEYTVTIQGNNNVVDNEVSFLESHKMYILIIGISVLTIIIVTTILIVDKKTKKNY